MIRRSAIIVAVVAIAVMAFAATASATTIRGTVVHKNKHAHSFVVARHSGKLVSIHARRCPALGRRVTVKARLLHNGTFAARSIHRGRLSHHVRLRGVVTFVDTAKGRFVVSAKGVSLVVNRKPTRTTGARGNGALPDVGTIVTVDGSLDDQGDINADTVENDGQNDDCADLEGSILSVDTVARTLTITADDNNDIVGAGIVVHIPDAWDMTAYSVGSELAVVATLNADGSYTAIGTSENGDKQEADNQDGEQGDYADVSGQVLTVDPVGFTLTMTVDNDDELAGTPIVVHIPDTWDMSTYAAGDVVQLVVTPNPDGSYGAVGTSEDGD
jgi:hypothetical protein